MLKNLICAVLVIVFAVAGFSYTYKVLARIELYSPRLRDSLEYAVKSGDEEAIGYYERVYLSKGIELF